MNIKLIHKTFLLFFFGFRRAKCLFTLTLVACKKVHRSLFAIHLLAYYILKFLFLFVSRRPTPLRATSGVSDRPQTSDTPKPKPTNVFYVWYTELCRRQNSNPVSTIRPNHLKNEQILDFVADRIKIEDWAPFFNALKLDASLHAIAIHSRMEKQKLIEDADTEDKVKRLKKWYGCICTRYVLRTLLRTLCSCLKNNIVLSYLELEGLLISGEYLEIILKGLHSNKTLKYLSFKSCPIMDEGCFEICENLHSLPNIEVLNLSSCGLGTESGKYIAKLIKYQQINRYCESWHSSLRYEEPEVNNMAGLKRFTLSNNPNIGDDGLELILSELIDDLWIRAIDMQRCNITEAIGDKIIDTLEYNRSLEIADFRNNSLEHDTLSRIFEVLKSKQTGDSEYQWCQTTTTLGSTVQILGSLKKNVTSSQSKTTMKTGVKRQMTMPFLPRKSEIKDVKENINNSITTDKQNLLKTKEQLMNLYERLKEETVKREKAEERCEELQRQIDELMSLKKNQVILKEFSNMKTYIDKFINFVQKNGNLEQHKPIIADLQNALNEVQVLAKPYERITKAVNNSANKGEIFSGSSGKAVRKDHSSCNVHTLFQNLTGEPLEEDEEDFGINLNLSPDTERSTDSESIETMKRFLEELSNEELRFSTTEDLSELSRSSESEENSYKLE